MSFGPKAVQVRECPACHLAIPLAQLQKCPTCGHELGKPGDLGSALVEAMTDVLGDATGQRRSR